MSENLPVHIQSQGFEYGVKHFYNRKSGSITEILFELLQLNAAEATHLLNLGAVYIDNQRQSADLIIAPDRLFRVHCKPRRYNCDYAWSERIVYENQDFVVLNKPSQLPSHPSVDNRIENSLSQLALAMKTELFITHRLDTLTSGLIVYAKNNIFVKNFNVQIQQRNVEKKYVALVESTHTLPPKLIHYMEPSPRAPKNVSDIFNAEWPVCELEIIEQKKQAGISWVKINLLTGRTHQIRAQLSHAQAPIVGDVLYGAKSEFGSGAIALRACELQFNWGSQRLQFNLPETLD